MKLIGVDVCVTVHQQLDFHPIFCCGSNLQHVVELFKRKPLEQYKTSLSIMHIELLGKNGFQKYNLFTTFPLRLEVTAYCFL